MIPCFNAEDSIAEAINSALGQTYPAVEVIVVDDGSTDGSLDVVKAFGDRIRFQTGPNKGGASARNTGIEIANGDFIQFLDADDLLDHDKLTQQVPLSLQHPDAIVYTDHYVVEGDAQPVLRSMPVVDPDPVLFVLMHKALTTLGPLHRRDWLRDVGGFTVGLRASQEFDLHLRLAANGHAFHHLPKPLFTVRRRADSVSSDTGRTLATLVEFFPSFVNSLKSRQTLTTDRRRACAGYAASIGRQCIRLNQTEAGEQLLEFAFDLDRAGAEQIAYGKVTRWLRRIVGSRTLEKLTLMRRGLSVA